MGTFFEKLTGGEPESASGATEVAPLREAARAGRRVRAAGTREPNAATHLKVEREAGTAAAEPAPSDEDGELTVDIYDTGDAIVIQSTVAGVKPEDLDISITNDTVAIRGRRDKFEEIEEKNYYYKELFWGGFSRTVLLPEEIEDDAAEATLKQGLLTIRLPKKKRGVVQKLKVKVN